MPHHGLSTIAPALVAHTLPMLAHPVEKLRHLLPGRFFLLRAGRLALVDQFFELILRRVVKNGGIMPGPDPLERLALRVDGHEKQRHEASRGLDVLGETIVQVGNDGVQAARQGGSLLPPYETIETLERLEDVLSVCSPRMVVLVGDSFDDLGAADALPEDIAERIARMAIVADRDVAFGLARMYQTLSTGMRTDVQIFRDLVAARSWLGLPD